MNNKIRLFTLAYAGGNAYIYNAWKKSLQPQIELIPIELPGHGYRIAEPLVSDVEVIVNDLWQQIQPYFQDNRPFAFFGHSMGSLLAFEMIHKVYIERGRYPVTSLFSGRVAPHIISRKEWSQLSDQAFIEKVITLGGIPDVILEHKELLEMIIPVLRADFKLVEQYRYNKQYEVFPFPITVLTGEQDQMTTIDIEAWSEYSSLPTTFKSYHGGHFFINTCAEQVLADIRMILLQHERSISL